MAKDTQTHSFKDVCICVRKREEETYLTTFWCHFYLFFVSELYISVSFNVYGNG